MSLGVHNIISIPSLGVGIEDTSSGGKLKLQSGNDISIRVLILDELNQVLDVSSYSTATLEFKALSASGSAPSEASDVLVQKIDSSLTSSPTKSQWASGAGEHIKFTLSDIETNLVGDHWMSVYLRTAGGEIVTILADKIEFLEDGVEVGGAPSGSASSFLISANNLSDVPDAAASRANLGVLYFDTKSDMAAYDVSSLLNGTIARLDGYNTKGDDGGGLFYLAKADASLVADDGVIIAGTGTNNFWTRMYSTSAGVHVDWFGAVGDDSTDDYAAIMKAVGSHMHINFGLKTYYVATPIGFTNEQIFEGVGVGTTLTAGTTIRGLTHCFSTTDGSNRDVQWRRLNLTSAGATSIGINVAGDPTGGLSNSSVVENCTFQKELQYGLKGTGQGLRIKDCIFGEHGGTTNMIAGVLLDGAVFNTAISIYSCKFRFSESGIIAQETSGIAIYGSIFESLTGVAVRFEGCGPVVMDGCYFENCRTSGVGDDGFIRLDSSSGGAGTKAVRVSGCYFINNGGANVGSIIAGPWVTTLEFTGNFVGMGGEGKYLFNGGVQKAAHSTNNYGIQASFTPLDYPTYNRRIDKLTTKGDILVYNGSEYVRLPIGVDGQILVADSTESAGIKWSTL